MGRYSKRFIEPEIMDDPELDASCHRLALDGLNQIQRWTGCSKSIYRSLRRIAKSLPSDRPMRVLDLGCADGWLCVQWLTMAKHDRLPIQLVGIDFSERAVGWARERSVAAEVQAEFICGNVMVDPLPSPVDVVIASLFLHHFDDHKIVEILRRIHRMQPGHVLIHDLDRGLWNAWLVRFAAHVLTTSGVVHTDSDRSMQAALTRHEMTKHLSNTGFHITYCGRSWPCRFKIEACCSAAIPMRERDVVHSLIPSVSGASVARHVGVALDD